MKARRGEANLRRTQALLDAIDGSGSRDERMAARKLAKTTEGLAYWLLHRYRVSSSWKARRSCVYFAFSSARTSKDAMTLGRAAIRDRSKYVRYRAFELLAWTQRKDALPALREVVGGAGAAGPDKADARAAMDAIESQNRYFFLDREHTGKVLSYTLDEFFKLVDAGLTPPSDQGSPPPGKRRRAGRRAGRAQGAARRA
jgi:hypothetical protein